ncbi:MAG: aspartate aminotransferase family protein [Bacteroidales bacterium]|nr:aspartate aminotransferase family protein [Bacteroidales bacterium]
MKKTKPPEIATNRFGKEIYDQAINLLPGGVSRNTVYRYPHPEYVVKAAGAYVTDIKGIERIDFANNMASLIHGHAQPEIVEAVTEQLKRGSAYTLATEIEVLYAQLLIDRAESFEKIRFVNSGTEAVMAMIKASRAFTNRPKIAKAEGAYHGSYDFAEVSQVANPTNWGDIDAPNSVPLAHGTPKGVTDNVIIFPYNDIERTLAILDKHKDEIAAILIDLCPHRVGLVNGTNEFIEALYKWTRENGALLIFDEVVTFRTNYGGAQQNYTVKPDLTALGKIIGGGFPVGALTGRTDVMEVLNPRADKILFPHSGTFSANPVTMTAGYMAMKMFDEKAVKDLNALTKVAFKQLEEVIKALDVPVSITGTGSMFRFHFLPTPPTTYREAYQAKEAKEIVVELLNYLFEKENIMMINTCACMFSTAMTQSEVDRLSQGMFNAFKHLKTKICSLQKK